MVIQCSACDTRFKIADDKLKPGGVKVRCSKCKEVFTVMPPEEEAPAMDIEISAPEPEPESDGGSWSDLDTSFDHNTTSEETDQSDWSNIDESTGSDAADSAAPSFDDFSFGDDTPAEEPADESFSFGAAPATEDEEEPADFSFATDSTVAEDEAPGISEDAFAFGGSEASDEPAESHGEGAQDEFAFDDSGNIALDATGSDDFDWDDSASDSDSDSLDFDSAPTASDESLDFSSISLQQDETPPPVAAPAPAPRPASAPDTEAALKRPASAKGPQKSAAGKKRTAKGRHSAKKKKGPWGTLVAMVLLLALLFGGGLYGMQQMGFWNGDFAQLGSADFGGFGEALWTRAETQIQKLLGNSVSSEPVGSIAIVEMGGRFVDNKTAGRLFVIDGKIRNDFAKPRSAIAVRGILYNAAGKAVAQQKVFCGNTLSTTELTSLPMAKILERGNNQFGDALSNLDIAPKATLPFTVVFGKIPGDIVEFNVEIAESSPGSQP